MVMSLTSRLTILILLLINDCFIVNGHDPLESEEDIREFARSQSSVYHCYPEILTQLERRKSSYSPSFFDQQPSISSKFGTLGFGSQTADDHDESQLDKESPSTLTCTRSINSSDRFHKIRNSTCVLSPVVRAGPYYHKEGHPIRQNLAEWQEGLPLYLDIGVIDVETCKPIEGALVDLWHANATGFYAGHPYPAPGLENEEPQVGGVRGGLLTAYPRKHFDEQWLRGAWPTNENGVARFTTIFPGYYTGRATHIHAEVHMNWETAVNQTFQSKDVQYIGQFFFDDEINMSVDKMWPYVQNPVRHRTRNWRDSLKVFQESHLNGFRPILDVVKVGSVINQGLMGFITVGVNISNHFDHNHNPMPSDLDFHH